MGKYQYTHKASMLSNFVLWLLIYTVYTILQVWGNELLDCSSSCKCHVPQYFHP